MSDLDVLYMPEPMRLDLCVDLLHQVGATKINVREGRGEIIHCCPMPWHRESRPSASLNYQKMTFKCLGCGSSGGILWFLSQTVGGNDLNFDARAWIGGKTGLGEKDFDLSLLLNYLDSLDEVLAKRKESVPIPVFSEKVLAPWNTICPLLTTGVPELGLPGQGLPEENLIAAKVGWDLQTNRAIIPHFWKGKLVGWQSRRLADDGSEKYLSTGDFPKDKTIYGYDDVMADKPPYIVVAESPRSRLRHLHHQPIVSTFGAAVTDHQIQLLKWVPTVIWWLDNDTAGWKALIGSEESPGVVSRLLPYTRNLVVQSDWHADPADLDDAEVDRLVAEAVDYSYWEPPTGALRCLGCKQRHGGPCQEVAA